MDTELVLDIEEYEEEEQEETKTYRIDFEKGKIEGKIDGIEAVEQAINKMILTERYENLIYSTDYGTEVKSTVYGEETSEDFIETGLEDALKEALLSDERIVDAGNFEFYEEYPDKDSLTVEFDVDTIYGDTHIETQIENGRVLKIEFTD